MSRYPQAFSLESTLVNRCMCTNGRTLRYTKCRLRTRRGKVIGQRKLRRSDRSYRESTTLSLSPPMCLFTQTVLFPSNRHFTCFATFCLLSGSSFLHSWKARAFSLATGSWWSSGWDLVLGCKQPWPDFNLWLETKALLQATTGKGHLRLVTGPDICQYMDDFGRSKTLKLYHQSFISDYVFCFMIWLYK